MSDDDIKKPGDDPDERPEGLAYGDKDVSGVFKSPIVRYEVEGEEKPEEVIDPVHEALMLQNIYGVRKEMRDSFRNVFERNEWAADLFGLKYIPPMTAQQIADEETERKKRKVRKLLLKQQGTHPTEAPEESAKNDLKKDPKIMNAEEYAKYIAGKKSELLKKGNYRKWRDEMLDIRYKFKTEAEKKVFYGLMKIEAEKAFTEALLSRDEQRITEGFMYLGGIELFDCEDLLDVPEDIFVSPEIKKTFIKLLAGMIPYGFFSVRNHLVKLGFFKSHAEIDSEPVIQEKAKEALLGALYNDPAVFATLRDTFNEAGFSIKSPEEQEEPFRKKVLLMLGKAATESPGKYLALRKQLEAFKMIDQDDADENDAVRWNLLGHKLAWKAVDPAVLFKLEYYWRNNGLRVMDEVFEGCFKDHKNPEFRRNPSEHITLRYRPIPPQANPGVRADMALYYFGKEKRKYQDYSEELTKLSEDCLGMAETKMTEFNAQFPQYNARNMGRGYEAEIVE